MFGEPLAPRGGGGPAGVGSGWGGAAAAELSVGSLCVCGHVEEACHVVVARAPPRFADGVDVALPLMVQHRF